MSCLLVPGGSAIRALRGAGAPADGKRVWARKAVTRADAAAHMASGAAQANFRRSWLTPPVGIYMKALALGVFH